MVVPAECSAMRIKGVHGMTEFTSKSFQHACQICFSLFLFYSVMRLKVLTGGGCLHMHESLFESIARGNAQWLDLIKRGWCEGHVNTAHMNATPPNLNCFIGWLTSKYFQQFPNFST